MLGPVLQRVFYRGFGSVAVIGVTFMGDACHQRLSEGGGTPSSFVMADTSVANPQEIWRFV